MQTERRKHQFVWVFGASAVGKQWLINRLVNGQVNPGLLKELGLDGYTIRECPLDQRYQVVEIFPSFATGVSTLALLIKGQTIDFNNKLPQEVKGKLPQVNHRIIFVFAHIIAVYARVKERARKNPSRWARETPDSCLAEYNTQLGWLRKLENNFETIYVDASSTEYRIIEILPG